jgi:hypothetical protein
MASTTLLSVDPALLSGVKALEKEIGHTPLHHITRLFQKDNVQVYAKQEWQQLSGSVKARAAYRIVRHAVEQGSLTTQKTLLDATSGNTGIAFTYPWRYAFPKTPATNAKRSSSHWASASFLPPVWRVPMAPSK